MGADQSNYAGGAQGSDLPPEVLGLIGQFSDFQTKTRMRRAGKDAFMVPKPISRDVYRHVKQHPARMLSLLLMNDTPDNRGLFEALVAEESRHSWSDFFANAFGIVWQYLLSNPHMERSQIYIDRFERSFETIVFIVSVLSRYHRDGQFGWFQSVLNSPNRNTKFLILQILFKKINVNIPDNLKTQSPPGIWNPLEGFSETDSDSDVDSNSDEE